MKYKLEFWPYGEFETEEAAERLNQRAGEGWELVGITSTICDIALYRRNADAVKYCYTADIVPSAEEKDAAYAALCVDAGWEMIMKRSNGLCIFVSRDGSGRPLHTNREIQFEHQLQVLAQNHVSTSVTAYLLGILFLATLWGYLFFVPYKETFGGWIWWYFPLYIIVVTREPLVYGLNLSYIKIARRHTEDGELVKRPEWLSKLYGWISVVTGICFAIMVVFAWFLELRDGIPVAVFVLANGLCLVSALLGIWQGLFKKNKGMEAGMNIVALAALILPLF